MPIVAQILEVDYNQSFGIMYANGKKEYGYILKSDGMYTENGRPTPYVLINILTGRAAIIKE